MRSLLRHLIERLVAVGVLLVCALSASAKDPDVLVQRCGTKIEATLEIKGDGRWSGTWCAARPVVLLAAADSTRRLRLELSETGGHYAAEIRAADDANVEQRKWTAATLRADGRFQALEAGPDQEPARLKLERDPDGSDQVAVRAIDQKPADILAALQAEGGVQWSGAGPPPTLMTLDFAAMDALAVLELLFYESGLVVLHAADGSVHTAAPRDLAEVQALQAAYAPLIQNATQENAEARLRLLEALRALVRVRDGADVPADAGNELEHLAMEYTLAARNHDRVTLRREMLAQRLRFDARPNSAALAMARAALAFALQEAAAPGDEDQDLLAQAEPVLLQDRAFRNADALHDAALALSRRGHRDSAIVLLERAMAREENLEETFAAEVASLAWVIDVEPVTWLLLSLYRDKDDVDAWRVVIGRWAKHLKDVDWPANIRRYSTIEKLLRDGRWAQAARDSELLFARMAPFDRIESWELGEMLAAAGRAHLALGEYRRVAELQALTLHVVQVRGAQLPNGYLERLRADQRQIDALVDVLGDEDASGPERPWNARYRSREPVAREGNDASKLSRRFLTMADLVHVLQSAADARWTAPATLSSEWWTLREHLAPLLLLTDGEEAARESLRQAAAARRAAGASAAELEQHRLRGERLLAAARRVR